MDWTVKQADLRRRSTRTAGVFAALTVASLSACSSHPSPLDRATLQRIAAEDARQAHARAADPPSSAPADTTLPGDPRTAEDYVALALGRNPSIRAAEARVRRLAQRGPQARSLDDPMFTVAPVGDMAETAAGQVGLMTSLSQRLPLPSKLDARGRIAELEAAQAEAELEQVRLQVAADARRAYWNYLFTTRAIETTDRSRSLLLQFRDVADAQFRVGQRSQQDVLRAAAELGNLDAELAVMAQRRDTAAAMLRQLVDAPPQQRLPEPVPTDEQEIVVQRDELLDRAADINPALRRVAERLEQFEQQQRLANLNRWPDLTVSVTYNAVDDEGLSAAANGQDQWWLGFGINLPIWAEKYDAAEREAIFGRLEAASELAAERDRVAFRVEDALLRLESQREVLDLLRRQVLPDARAAVEAAASTYQTGTGDFLALVDNWRRLLGYEVMEHQVVASVEQALADLQQAVGADIDRATGTVRTGSPPASADSAAAVRKERWQ
ncbi:MAG: TolC family protein [Phycisphaerales bacterium]|nr:TolC family protein [Phycisphaerales bacterium]